MMAAHVNKSPALIITFVLFFQLVSGEETSSQCVDGTYDHGGLKCCKCAIGQYVKTHCTANLQYGQCEHCDVGTFSSEPSGQMVCEPCIPCSHENANLEVEEECTIAVNTKCRCKKDHYFIGTDKFKVCSPCAKCPEGIKEPCKGNNNTICNEKIEGADNKGTTIGIIVLILLLIAVVVGAAVWCYCRKKQRGDASSQHQNGNVQVADVELTEVRPLIEIPEKDLQPYLPDIAEVIGWTDMKDIAIRSEIPMTKIEDCKLNHPGDAGEQTIELLQVWVESQGLAAGDKLYKILEKTGKNLKADKVREILLRGQTENSA